MKFRTNDLELINRMNRNTLMEVLSMECVEITENGIKIRMPVDSRTHQPMGLLHGGASAALIESIGSMGSALILDLEKEVPVGVEINANHLSGVRSGFVVAEGKLVHCGKRTHVWQVDIFSDENRSHVCTGRLTVMIIPKP
jgi:1,4-dihydroxy-2-naphthoyl-CoA hydrolase